MQEGRVTSQQGLGNRRQGRVIRRWQPRRTPSSEQALPTMTWQHWDSGLWGVERRMLTPEPLWGLLSRVGSRELWTESSYARNQLLLCVESSCKKQQEYEEKLLSFSSRISIHLLGSHGESKERQEYLSRIKKKRTEKKIGLSTTCLFLVTWLWMPLTKQYAQQQYSGNVLWCPRM